MQRDNNELKKVLEGKLIAKKFLKKLRNHPYDAAFLVHAGAPDMVTLPSKTKLHGNANILISNLGQGHEGKITQNNIRVCSK